jgi:hypothetical protein
MLNLFYIFALFEEVEQHLIHSRLSVGRQIFIAEFMSGSSPNSTRYWWNTTLLLHNNVRYIITEVGQLRECRFPTFLMCIV